MMRHCGGTDPNLTRKLTASETVELITSLPPGDGLKLSPWDGGDPDCVVIQCRCGARFDDAQQAVVWPHELLAPRIN